MIDSFLTASTESDKNLVFNGTVSLHRKNKSSKLY